MIKTPQSTALELVVGALNAEIGCNIVVAPLPEEGGVAAEISGGMNKGRYLNKKHGKEQLTVLFLCKNKNQLIAYNTLCAIGNNLNCLEPIETGNVYVSGAEIRSGAGLVGNDGGYYIYSMIAGIDIIF